MSTPIRQATVADAMAACHVLRRSIAECCAQDHRNEPSLVDAWLQNKTPGNVRSWLQSNSYAVVAETGDSVVGFALLLSSGELALCYLVPEALSKGLGSGMLDAIEAEATRRGLSNLYLESTMTARDFYLRNGFSTSGAPTFAFGIAAYPMSKRLSAGHSLSGNVARTHEEPT